MNKQLVIQSKERKEYIKEKRKIKFLFYLLKYLS